MNDETPTIEAEEGWPDWAEWYAVDGGRWLYEDRPTYIAHRLAWEESGRADIIEDGHLSLRRIVRTPKAGIPLKDAIDLGAGMLPYLAVIDALAIKLALCGCAAWAYNTLKQNNIPVPALVEREATGKDKEETNV